MPESLRMWRGSGKADKFTKDLKRTCKVYKTVKTEEEPSPMDMFTGGPHGSSGGAKKEKPKGNPKYAVC